MHSKQPARAICFHLARFLQAIHAALSSLHAWAAAPRAADPHKQGGGASEEVGLPVCNFTANGNDKDLHLLV
eukprot:75291-Pyramimonas_sp.AAC.2